MKFRKIHTVEAVQFVVDRLRPYHPSEMFLDLPVFHDGKDRYLYIDTHEGLLRARPGDWILTGIDGERWPCKPDIFARTYEAVE